MTETIGESMGKTISGSRRFLTALLALSSLIVGILLCEVFLRKTGYLRTHYLVPDKPFLVVDPDPRMGYGLMPGYHGNPVFFYYRDAEFAFPRVTYRINKQGFRGSDWFPLDEEAHRIMVMGDSFAFGLGVEDEETFPSVLEKGLNEWAETEGIQSRFRVFNLGVPGYNIQQQYVSFKRWAPEIKPEMVIHSYYYDDCDPRLNYALGTAAKSFEQRFPSHVLFLLNVFRLQIPFLAPSTAEGLEKSVCMDYIDRLHGAIRAAGARPLAFQFLSVHHVDALRGGNPVLRKSLEKHMIQMKEKFQENGVEYVDMMEALSKRPSRQLMLTPVDVHPNPEGHAIIGTALVKKVVESFREVRPAPRSAPSR